MSGPGRSTPAAARRLAVVLFITTLAAAARPSPAWLLAGAVVAGIGEALRLWASGYLVKTEILITAGPYARTRNPLYLGRLLLLTGTGLAATLPHHLNFAVLAGGIALFFIYYLPRKERVEGDRLRRKHGARYEAYRAAVPALFPSFRRYDALHVPWSFALMVRNRELVVLAGLVVLFSLLAHRAAGG